MRVKPETRVDINGNTWVRVNGYKEEPIAKYKFTEVKISEKQKDINEIVDKAFKEGKFKGELRAMDISKIIGFGANKFEYALISTAIKRHGIPKKRTRKGRLFVFPE